jgi:hypothetical protein
VAAPALAKGERAVDQIYYSDPADRYRATLRLAGVDIETLGKRLQTEPERLTPDDMELLTRRAAEVVPVVKELIEAIHRKWRDSPTG